MLERSVFLFPFPDVMILYTIILSLLIYRITCDSRLDLKSCRYKNNACIGIEYLGPLNYSLAMNRSEGCFLKSNCDIILRGTVKSKNKIEWILRIATTTIYRGSVKDIHMLVRFGVKNDLENGIHVEFNTARAKPNVPSMYSPYGESMVEGLPKGHITASTNQSVYFMENYWPADITKKTKYFYIYFWSSTTISYEISTKNETFYTKTNLTHDDYYVNLYAHRYTNQGGFSAQPANLTITKEKINLFRYGPTKPITPSEESGNTLLIILLIVVIIFTIAVAILLIMCCISRRSDPVSMETQPRKGGITTFQSAETSDTKRPKWKDSMVEYNNKNPKPKHRY